MCIVQSLTNNAGIYLQSICCKEIEVLFPVVLLPNAGHGPSFLRFLDYTWWHTTISRTPVDEWSAGQRDLYLTPYSTQQMPMTPVWFEPTISAGEQLQVYAFDCTATMTDTPWEPGCTPLYVGVGLRGWWPYVFHHMYTGGLLSWDSGRCTRMNEKWKVDQWLWWWSITAHGDPVRERGVGSLTGDSEGRLKRDVLSVGVWYRSLPGHCRG